MYYGLQDMSEKKRAKEMRNYELSQVHNALEKPPLQVPFRHLCNLLLSTAGDIDAAINAFPGGSDTAGKERERLRTRARCGWNWIQKYAPEDFSFTLKTGDENPVDLAANERSAVIALRSLIEAELDTIREKDLSSRIYDIARGHGMEPKDFFRVMYLVLVGKEQGPRLAGFLQTLGKDRVLLILRAY